MKVLYMYMYANCIAEGNNVEIERKYIIIDYGN